ncbi:hypothetical protein BOX15_Mlig029002g1 [Macrostomum lignano]|uniref:Uncharacterized protein n=1 Tax=Macrostomum lignano TaxID=282301 RepID=A0A267GKR6_9PLAT|nr:hypothetical protein BOX15_Mlig029002g1 [Macrostomum lignano]
MICFFLLLLLLVHICTIDSLIIPSDKASILQNSQPVEDCLGNKCGDFYPTEEACCPGYRCRYFGHIGPRYRCTEGSW